MLIETSRFGTVEIDQEKVVSFSEGVLGFPEHRRYALLQIHDDGLFFWLQSVDDPGLAFVVADPRAFVPDYQAPIRADDVDLLALRDLDDCQVLVIVNKSDSGLTANLLGPLVIGAQSLRGKQLVLSDKRYSTRHRIAAGAAATAVSRTA